MTILKKILIGVLVLFTILVSIVLFNRNTVTLSESAQTLENDQCFKYHYSSLNNVEKDYYAKLYYCFLNNEKTLSLTISDIEEVRDSFKAVLFDHPEFYYIDKTFQYVNFLNHYQVRIGYSYSTSQRQLYDQGLTYIKEDIKDSTKSLKPIEKMKYIYDYIIENVTYKETKNDQDMISALIDHKSVCAGYAKAYQYLLNSVGIDSTYIQGKTIEGVNGQQAISHAWLMVKINDDYFYSDPTWGDFSQNGFEHVCDATFLLTEEEMKKLYQTDIKIQPTKKNFDYYKYTSRYMNQLDANVVSNAAKFAYNHHTGVLEIKCQNSALMNILENKANHSQFIYQILNQNGIKAKKAQYVKRQELNIFEVHYIL